MYAKDFDKGLKPETSIGEADIVWLDAKEAPFVIHGLFREEDHYARLPQELAKSIPNSWLTKLGKDTSGGRVRFRTDSSYIAICAVMKNEYFITNQMTMVAQCGFDMYRREERGDIYCSAFMPPLDLKTGYSAGTGADGKMHDYTINFPLHDGVKELYIALKKDAVLEAPTPYAQPKPVVYYGSSITQGMCACRPGNSYPAILARRLDADFINLGFAGNCKAEQSVVEYIASLDMSVFVCDYDHNTPSLEYLEQTHLPLYRTFRAAKPDVPIIFLTAHTILLTGGSYIKRREIIRKTYETAVAEGDKNVYFVDGATLHEGDCWDTCTVDGTHPNDLGFFRMAMQIEKVLKPLL